MYVRVRVCTCKTIFFSITAKDKNGAGERERGREGGRGTVLLKMSDDKVTRADAFRAFGPSLLPQLAERSAVFVSVSLVSPFFLLFEEEGEHCSGWIKANENAQRREEDEESDRIQKVLCFIEEGQCVVAEEGDVVVG